MQSPLLKLPQYVCSYISRIHFSSAHGSRTTLISSIDLTLFMDINHVLIYGLWCMKKDVLMGVRTNFIISNQAGTSHVSIWKSFTEIHHLLIDKPFRKTCQFTSWLLWKYVFGTTGRLTFLSLHTHLEDQSSRLVLKTGMKTRCKQSCSHYTHVLKTLL